MRMDVTAGLYVRISKTEFLKPVKECFSSRTDKLASKSEGKQSKNQALPSSMSSYMGYYQRVWPRVRMDFLTSNELDLRSVFLTEVFLNKKNPSQVCPAVWVLINSRHN